MKKTLAIITIISIFICSCALTCNAKTAYKIGDVDTDKSVSISDATTVQMFVAQLYSLNNISKLLADVDNDSSVTVMDATMIQLFLARLVDDFPANDNPPSQGSIDKDGYFDQIVMP